MNSTIAVLVDSLGQTASLFEATAIKRYGRRGGKWTVIEEYPFRIATAQGVKALRESLVETIAALGETKTIAGKEIAGLTYNILDTAGFRIFEAEGMPEVFLDSIANATEENMESLLQPMQETQTAACPKQTEIEGNYYINLKELQIHNPEITSKKVLLPFLKNESFYELEVVCSHIPPWLERDFDKLGLKFDAVQTSQNECRVKIFRKVCSESSGE